MFRPHRDLCSVSSGSLRTLPLYHLSPRAPYLELHPADEKNRQGARIPIRRDLAKDIREWLDTKLIASRREAKQRGGPLPAYLPLDTVLFKVPKGLVKILDRDIEFAGIPKRDERGRTIDVHALRHTFGTHLSEAGVPLRTAQAALRHSDPKLTANVYTDPKLLDVAGALNSLPVLPIGSGADEDRQTVSANSSPTLAPMLAPNPGNHCISQAIPDNMNGVGRVTEGRADEGATVSDDTSWQGESTEGLEKEMAYPEGLEPPTPWSVAKCSIQLSHGYA